jgi:hypothetical protein
MGNETEIKKFSSKPAAILKILCLLHKNERLKPATRSQEHSELLVGYIIDDPFFQIQPW